MRGVVGAGLCQLRTAGEEGAKTSRVTPRRTKQRFPGLGFFVFPECRGVSSCSF